MLVFLAPEKQMNQTLRDISHRPTKIEVGREAWEMNFNHE